MSEIGARIRKFRELKGYKTQEFSKITGVPQSRLSEIENNPTGVSTKNIDRIVKNTNINPAWLLTGEGEIEKPIGSLVDGLP
ncbi:MAG: helix-turn-helix transcriptional regulator, partial [Candidatus Paceibacterota bacterium]